jgi:UDP-N-acetylglucosamine transferase subunit ALG13
MNEPPAGGTPPALRAVTVVGTDHHPFDRLITWVNGWLMQHPERAAGFYVQSGTASVTPACPSSPYLGIDQLRALLDQADVMICHGGPESIADAWSRGQVPIAVPRRRRLGEHVDDHQLDFCRRFADLGRVRLAETEADFADLLDEAARNTGGFRVVSGDPGSSADEVVARFATLVDELVSRPRRRAARASRAGRLRPRLTNGSGVRAAASDPSGGLAPTATTRKAAGTPGYTGPAGTAGKERE